MSVAKITQLRAEQVQEELAEASKEALEASASTELVERMKLVTGTLAFWLQPPGDDFQIRAALGEAELLLREWANHQGQRRAAAQSVPSGMHKRVPESGVTIRVRVTEAANLKQFYMDGVSQGGMFLRATRILPPNSNVLVVLVMPDAQEIKIGCRVVRVVPPDKATDKEPSGMQLAFVELAAETRAKIASYVDELKLRSKPSRSTTVPPHFEMPEIDLPDAGKRKS
jgi:Tfp pilus assembly protein PilZ